MAIKKTLTNAAKWLCDTSGVPRYFIRNNAMEAKMAAIRLYGLAPWRRMKVDRLQRRGDLRLIFGCGTTRYPGWIGIDCFAGGSVDLMLDLRRRLPFRDASVEYCYSEHFLEHLYPEEAVFHLKEVRRVLKPKGVYRIVVPAGIQFAKKYLEGDKDFFALAHPWEARPLDALYKIVNWQGQHRSLYDFAQLEYLAQEVGFAQARESVANQSVVPELRIDRSEPQRVAESLYVELVKD
jgi:predicted SAM-dependent methyltransferase